MESVWVLFNLRYYDRLKMVFYYCFDLHLFYCLWAWSTLFAISIKGQILYIITRNSNTFSTIPTSHIFSQNYFPPTPVTYNLHTIKFPFLLFFLLLFCHPRKFLLSPLYSCSLPYPQPLVATDLFSVPIVLPLPGCRTDGVIQLVAFESSFFHLASCMWGFPCGYVYQWSFPFVVE